MNGQSNVDKLREAKVLPEGIVLKPAHEKSINDLTTAEMKAVLDVHAKVGTVELSDPVGRLFIF